MDRIGCSSWGAPHWPRHPPPPTIFGQVATAERLDQLQVCKTAHSNTVRMELPKMKVKARMTDEKVSHALVTSTWVGGRRTGKLECRKKPSAFEGQDD